MTFSFPASYQICLAPSSPLFSLRLQISSSVFHFCLYPWCIKFRDSSTHFKLIFILPYSTSWKPSLMHYPGVSRQPLCLFPLPGTLVALMPKRMLPLPSEDFTATTNFLAMTFFPGLQFSHLLHSEIFKRKECSTDNMFSRWLECTWHCNRRWCWQDGNFSSPFWWPGAMSACPILCQPCS